MTEVIFCYSSSLTVPLLLLQIGVICIVVKTALQYEIMNKRIKEFYKRIASGLKQEYQETKDIPKNIKNKNYKEVKQQVADLGKMAFIVSVWILPAGAILSGFIMKLSKRMRPSSFQNKDEKNKKKE